MAATADAQHQRVGETIYKKLERHREVLETGVRDLLETGKVDAKSDFVAIMDHYSAAASREESQQRVKLFGIFQVFEKNPKHAVPNLFLMYAHIHTPIHTHAQGAIVFWWESPSHMVPNQAIGSFDHTKEIMPLPRQQYMSGADLDTQIFSTRAGHIQVTEQRKQITDYGDYMVVHAFKQAKLTEQLAFVVVRNAFTTT